MKSKINPTSFPNFSDTQVAFANKSDQELLKAAWLFSLMSKPWLVNSSSQMMLWAINNNIPFVEKIVKLTIFDQFCGGTSVEDCQLAINKLANQNVLTVLDYGAEAKNTEQEFNASMEELLRAIDFTSQNQSVAVVSMKITGLVKFSLLEKVQSKKPLTTIDDENIQNLIKRLTFIGQAAEKKSVCIFVDAEESWIQDVIDDLVNNMMRQHNKHKAIIFNTFQMYRHDRLDFLKESFFKAKKESYILGAKLVRGAYMEKERDRAEKMNYPSPIQIDKSATDKDFNSAVNFCIEQYQNIASFNASHNLESNALQAELMLEKGIDKNHPHLNFCQLYGMSDQITFNLGATGFNAMKYVPYGQIKEVIPYLIRRAQENTSVSGEMGREHELILNERKRRKSV